MYPLLTAKYEPDITLGGVLQAMLQPASSSSKWFVDVGAKLCGKTFSYRNPKNTPCIILQGCICCAQFKRISREVRTCSATYWGGKPSPTSSLIPKLKFIGNPVTYGHDTDSGFDLHSLDGTCWYLWTISCQKLSHVAQSRRVMSPPPWKWGPLPAVPSVWYRVFRQIRLVQSQRFPPWRQWTRSAVLDASEGGNWLGGHHTLRKHLEKNLYHILFSNISWH